MLTTALLVAMVLHPAFTAADDPAPDTTRTIVYTSGGATTPVMRTWNGSAWSSASNTLNIAHTARWIVSRACTARTERLAACVDTDKDLHVMTFNGVSWSGGQKIAEDTGTDVERPFDVEYEHSSGDALIVYRSGGADRVAYYRTWNGVSWSAEQSVSLPGSDRPKFIRLVARPGSDEIMCLVLDNKKDLSALVWNGSAFVSTLLLDGNTATNSTEHIDAAYESTTGRCLVAWCNQGSSPPTHRMWTGSAWLNEVAMPNVSGKSRWLRLAADPASARLIALVLGDNDDLSAVVWSGTAWGTPTVLEASAPNVDRRNFDVAFEPSGTRAIAAYGQSGSNQLRYRLFDGTSWGAEVAGPDMGGAPGVVQALPDYDGAGIHWAVKRASNGALYATRWTGAAMTGPTTLASSTDGSTGSECFMLAGVRPAPESTKPRIVNWREVAPATP